MNAALLFLTEAWRYEQVEDTDLTAAETAAKWYEIYVQYLTGECEGVGCCTELRTDPNTGRLQYTEDGGLTWFDVAEGPWIDAPNVASAAPPPPLNQGTDEADRCLAAWNAADVIAEFYRQTAGAAAAGLHNTLLSMNMFLNELNNALLEIAYPQAGRLLNASGFLDFDWGEYAEAPTLDSTALEALRCLLYCNATVEDGIVSFDHGAVYDNLIADLGTNPGTAVTLLVGYMGEAGLNHAGGVLANETAECECEDCPEGEWCKLFDFNAEQSQLGWQADAAACVMANWYTPLWAYIAVNYCGGQPIVTRIKPAVNLGDSETILTHVEVYASANGAFVGRPWELVTRDVTTSYNVASGPSWQGGALSSPVTGPIRPNIGATASGSGGLEIYAVRLRGTGTPPVGGVDC